jgi:hypothetical protein
LNGNLEVLSEEDSSMPNEKQQMDGAQLIHSPSEKRYKHPSNQDTSVVGLLPQLNHDRSQDENGSLSSRHASPVLLKSQASKKLKQSQQQVSIS